MKVWFEELGRRERLILIFGGSALLLMLLYSLLWSPLSEQNERLRDDIKNQNMTLAWMQQAAQQVKRGGAQTAQRTVNGESLLTLVDRTAKSSTLGGSIKRVQPDKDGGVRIWLERVEFNSMMRWLATLSRHHGVVLSNSNIEKQLTPGLVDARLTLKGSHL
ncbi:hypothetical protein MNBD_GAMMA18-1310 [hydrothermal vent metagenome]|uniref:General secretion pathway protein M n=1 Tax=hydrothermal vent metagenome TaxID=652676 RepID=A0A3B0ZKM9_9ZZZZ